LYVSHTLSSHLWYWGIKWCWGLSISMSGPCWTHTHYGRAIRAQLDAMRVAASKTLCLLHLASHTCSVCIVDCRTAIGRSYHFAVIQAIPVPCCKYCDMLIKLNM